MSLYDRLIDFFAGNRWSLAWPHIFVALLVPFLIAAVGDRLIKRR